jgi:CheY-like chemotaxis protein
MVLIIEDEDISRRALQQLLRLNGYDTCTAGSAEEAMSLVDQQGPPSVALVDINLPGMSGVEFVQRVHRRFPELSCIFMTANDEANDERIRAGQLEPTLRKPFDMPSLLTMINGMPISRNN